MLVVPEQHQGPKLGLSEKISVSKLAFHFFYDSNPLTKELLHLLLRVP
jgi:hypothetical protein